MHIKVILYGDVHGVFCRQGIKEKAEILGLKGYARNLRDGTVEAVFEGGKERIDKMILFCKKGPGHASVDSIKVVEGKEEGFGDFKII